MYKILSIAHKLPDVSTAAFSDSVSLTDYDIVIVDPTHVILSFPTSEVDNFNKRHISGKPAHSILEIIHRRRSEFSALLNKGRLVITFLDPLYDVTLNSRGFGKEIYVSNYSWLPDDDKKRFTYRLIEGTGTGLKLVQKSHLFSPYFSAFQKELGFNAYVDIPVSSFDLGDAFISNSADLTVGFSFQISNGMVVFLPKFKFNDENNRKFLGVLLQIAKKYFGADAKTPPPDWVNMFAVPGTELLQEKVREVQEKIVDLETQKTDIIRKCNELDEFKFLLYEQGHGLERKILDALRLMGFKAETMPGENTDFDVVLEAEEGRAVAEIEGKDDSSIHKEKIDQLLSAINQDAEKANAFAKGVLIGNHYRLKPIEQRGEPFTETVMRLAKQYHYALVITIELYRAVEYLLGHPDDEDFKRICRKSILDSDGEIVRFPVP